MLTKLVDPEIIQTILFVIIGTQYLFGRITKKQFIIEQKKAKGLIKKEDAKTEMAKSVLGPIALPLDMLNYIPIVNTRIPGINKSVPDIVKEVIASPFGLLGDILHNIPFGGTNVKEK